MGAKAKLTVVVPTHRSVSNVLQVIRDFRNQTRQDFDLLLVHDGPYPAGWEAAVCEASGPNMYYTNIPKSKDTYPGTSGRNRGIELAITEYVCFSDDDDRVKSTYVERLMSYNAGHVVGVVQMRLRSNKIDPKNDPLDTRDVPEIELNHFPIRCHCGTPVMAVKSGWARACPWQDVPDHDWQFFNDIVKLYKPHIVKIPSVEIDVDGCTVGPNPDWLADPTPKKKKRGPQ